MFYIPHQIQKSLSPISSFTCENFHTEFRHLLPVFREQLVFNFPGSFYVFTSHIHAQMWPLKGKSPTSSYTLYNAIPE